MTDPEKPKSQTNENRMSFSDSAAVENELRKTYERENAHTVEKKLDVLMGQLQVRGGIGRTGGGKSGDLAALEAVYAFETRRRHLAKKHAAERQRPGC